VFPLAVVDVADGASTVRAIAAGAPARALLGLQRGPALAAALALLWQRHASALGGGSGGRGGRAGGARVAAGAGAAEVVVTVTRTLAQAEWAAGAGAALWQRQLWAPGLTASVLESEAPAAAVGGAPHASEPANSNRVATRIAALWHFVRVREDVFSGTIQCERLPAAVGIMLGLNWAGLAPGTDIAWITHASDGGVDADYE
jgi:hypothetical protein